MENKKALITGASSGFGKVFAEQLAKEGYSLVLVARREDRLKTLSESIRSKYGASVEYIVQDLSTLEGVETVCSMVEDIDLLINSAGFGLIGEFSNLDIKKELNMIDLNIKGLYYLTKVYGLKMANKNRGGIINIASTAAFSPVPRFAVYAATKAFVLSFTEAVSKELEKSGVQVMALCPGPSTTEFFDVANPNKKTSSIFRLMTPEQVVCRGLKAYKKGKRVYIPGFINWFITTLGKFTPRNLALNFVSIFFK